VHETINPVLVRRLELITDSGGAGCWRGGCGLRKDIELKAASAVMTLLGERHSHPGYALAGGQAGSLASTTVFSGNELIEMGSKDVRALKRGDVVSFRLNGGAGWGDARERDQRQVAEDVAEGYVSAEAAKRVYGWPSG
jgi:N-methylhydantoinase B